MGAQMEDNHSKVVSAQELHPGPVGASQHLALSKQSTSTGQIVLVEDVFRRMLMLERRRAERSGKPFILMLISADGENGSGDKKLREACSVCALSARETDLVGWYRTGVIVGIIFTEIGDSQGGLIAETLRTKFRITLHDALGPAKADKISISVHIFPQVLDQDLSSHPADSKLYPDLGQQSSRKQFLLAIKRAIDISCSLAILVILSPILAAIALTIRLTSPGPVLFEQERLGQFGARFKCLKFRTMYTDCDPKIHQEFVRQFIAGAQDGMKPDTMSTVYKITNDPRVTLIGQFLRKTSLDELPQFWNVLRGEMSLVGPRPPLPYEFKIYEVWHRRRVLELRPGITGLWQVSGRSRMKFDEMVRLDLRYHQNWSLWLDIRILAATPRAVLSGEGAY
jgi:lipopolysaccharide/colanic/teichoic acid biosynthesis glycosyltransferase